MICDPRHTALCSWLGSRRGVAESASVVARDGRTRKPRREPPERSCCARTTHALDTVWVPETLFSSCDVLIFVDEAAESVEPAHAVNVGCASLCDRT
jgi:hypothetical protein